MENVSKALIISAGILFAILVLTLLVIFFNQMSSYYSEQNKAKMIEQTTEFNNKFDNYSGKDIRGNELTSVMNRVVDYNRTYADIQDYERIIITVDLKGHKDDLVHDGTPENCKLFKNDKITNSNGDNNISDVSNLASKVVDDTGIEETKLQKLSSDIDIVCNSSTDDNNKDTRNKKIKSILGYVPNDTELKKIQNATYKYYQLTQFKRAMFKCTEIVHSQTTGRVNNINFEAVIDNGIIKSN